LNLGIAGDWETDLDRITRPAALAKCVLHPPAWVRGEPLDNPGVSGILRTLALGISISLRAVPDQGMRAAGSDDQAVR
jgi:hypothetical protein